MNDGMTDDPWAAVPALMFAGLFYLLWCSCPWRKPR